MIYSTGIYMGQGIWKGVIPECFVFRIDINMVTMHNNNKLQ